ncbi:hypothetical protein BGZ63DRAFT_380914 [Mariannaea sp. PMI_226]|nr:hypothetical protein BGZ63DRAFT_380914 [Mariannaea sp. PMI_226]
MDRLLPKTPFLPPEKAVCRHFCLRLAYENNNTNLGNSSRITDRLIICINKRPFSNTVLFLKYLSPSSSLLGFAGMPLGIFRPLTAMMTNSCSATYLATYLGYPTTCLTFFFPTIELPPGTRHLPG